MTFVPLRNAWLQGALVSTLLPFATGVGSGEIAQAPLYLSIASRPHVLLAIDTAASMESEVLMTAGDGAYRIPGLQPESSTYQYLFPDGAMAVGNSSQNVPPLPQFADARAAAANRIYFDPEVEYRPWVSLGADDLTFADADPTRAPWFPNNLIANPHGPNHFDLTVEWRREDQFPNHLFSFNAASGAMVPAGTLLHFSGIDPIGPVSVGCNDRLQQWCKTARSGMVSDPRLGVVYYPAQFYLPRGTRGVSKPAGYASFRSEDPSCLSTATSWDGRTWDGFQIRRECFANHDGPDSEYGRAIQNFANWFTYHRRRKLAAVAAIGDALAEADRLQLGTFPMSEPPARLELEDFQDPAAKARVFRQVYEYPSRGESAIRDAIRLMGEQFPRWVERRCQRNFAVIVSAGTEDGSTSEVANLDGALPPPFGPDILANTAADMALRYYLALPGLPHFQPGARLPAGCPADPRLDCNPQPHMNLYAIGLGFSGHALGPDRPQDPFLHAPTWPSRLRTRADRIDDLWHATINGRGALYSAQRAGELSERLRELLGAASERRSTAGLTVSEPLSPDGERLLYQTQFDSTDWSGNVAAFVVRNGSPDTIPLWVAANKVPAWDRRNIYTLTGCSDGGASPSYRAVEFRWEQLGCDQQRALSLSPPAPRDPALTPADYGAQRLRYLRGDTGTAAERTGEFRHRNNGSGEINLLGDFINSMPALAAAEDFGYDRLPQPEGPSYPAFVQAKRTRRPLLYVGGNDGLLHGFDASASASEGGRELFAYLPSGLLPRLGTYAAADYRSDRHRYFVDGTPRIFDAFLNGRWRNLLIGGTGAGGRILFGLDVTDPDRLDGKAILWERSPRSESDDPHLGYSMAQAALVRTRSSRFPWVVVVGNGYGSPAGTAVLLILDPTSGKSIREIDTGAGGNGVRHKNGLSSPLVVDIEQDRIADYVYAGDLLGNLWKFDLTGQDPESWRIAFGSFEKPEPLFVACADHTDFNCSDTARQPITSKPQAAPAPLTRGGLMIYFGTGKYFEHGDHPSDTEDDGSKAVQVQSLYGLWDRNRGDGDDRPTAAKLVRQRIEGVRSGPRRLRLTSSKPVDYRTGRGWLLDLTGPSTAIGERVMHPPLLHDGRVTFTSFAPHLDPCDGGGSSWLMELDAATGGALEGSVPIFDSDGDRRLTPNDLVGAADGRFRSPSGIELSGVPSSTLLFRQGETLQRFTGLSTGEIAASPGLGDPARSGRASWRQLR